MDQTVRSVEDVLARLRMVERGIVTFDGCTGAGKTTMAAIASWVLGHPAIDVDLYVNKNKGSFIDELQVPKLRRYVEQALARSPVLLLSGVCMGWILQRIDQQSALAVYVWRRSSIGLPYDTDIIDAEEGAQFEGYESIISATEYDPTAAALDRELHAYHADCHPVANADLLFLRKSAE
ncbi:hypothetical protein [Burkholderia vietnamiensis]|uniref:hypothetical protein n=1 Tax=Burkholderia vietnamiensis TaxID=60552 RepID=UPI002861FCC3|nr:hypothetical protein [Burkholderia vietnamiensis]MEC4598954.1 hypothetical protein [Burkholderia vietnamiensis]HDR9189919.1 hypothetical protein [Burkholderia vietnamiensis]HDV8354343.1 hypothetical protein [Burkholderia vietnamiensis]